MSNFMHKFSVGRFSCCYKCEHREVGCHSTCERYLQECERNDEARDVLYSNNRIDTYKRGRANQGRKYESKRNH